MMKTGNRKPLIKSYARFKSLKSGILNLSKIKLKFNREKLGNYSCYCSNLSSGQDSIFCRWKILTELPISNLNHYGEDKSSRYLGSRSVINRGLLCSIKNPASKIKI